MTLDELITALRQADPAQVVRNGFASPHSYRGYYSELAFEPAQDVTVGDMLDAAVSALGETYEGYKGGSFTMSGGTDCYLAVYGRIGRAISEDTIMVMLNPPISRAEVLQEAANALDAKVRAIRAADRFEDGWGDTRGPGLMAAITELRRMADETAALEKDTPDTREDGTR
ncbi:hypothetical protein [Streptomyces jumonjinensis]|uniref:Uncharacterized protein n=1 Tax=Streptomyces jumonjinensis TaxID=1945 RepID=A0A646KLD8_STRJU|nr:hypothetical protein [Streptomyces jumonjinensis]MQT03122.1 hypothetical protein [Streptomyces jumonjinensis]